MSQKVPLDTAQEDPVPEPNPVPAKGKKGSARKGKEGEFLNEIQA